MINFSIYNKNKLVLGLAPSENPTDLSSLSEMSFSAKGRLKDSV